MVIQNVSGAAIAGPYTMPIFPTSSGDQMCAPITTSTPSITPASIISSAPPGYSSSACWKSKRTSPGNCSRDPESTFAVASSIAVCASCPQACITPARCDANSKSFSSWIGRASMSARIAST